MNVLAYLTGHTHNYSIVDITGVWQVDAGHVRGLGDTGARSTFIMININNDVVSYDTYRDDAAGGDYTLMHTGYLTGGPTPTPTPLCTMESFINTGDYWFYRDDGSDQGTAWRDLLFDDTGWVFGPSQLGYGDGDEATVVSYGPDPNQKFITTYFRHWFEVTAVSEINVLTLELLRDDGGIVYLNGNEIARTNMPGDPVDFMTTALVAVGGASESSWHEFAVDPALVVDGWNLMAVEIHQISGTSSDISMDMTVRGCRLLDTPTPAPTPSPVPGCVHHGDVNLDGIISTGDAQFAFFIILSMISPTPEEACAADCNGDGSITSGDAQSIFGAALEMDDCLDPLP